MTFTLTCRVLLVGSLIFSLASCQSSISIDSIVESEDEHGQHFVAEYEVVPFADAATVWPKSWQLSIDLTLAQPKTGKYRRPYVAVWIENEKEKPLRFLTLWGTQAKYHRDLRDFWVYTKRNTKEVDAVTTPTRGAGQYKLTWDGRDELGKPLPAGDYTVHIEVVREHGTRVHMKQTITCGGAIKVAKLEGNVEVDDVTFRFGPAAAKP